jgi:hypothetical protein
MNQREIFNDAVRIVTQELTPESARVMRYAIERNKAEAFKVEDGAFGVAFRNLLANRGVVWEEAILYSVWFAVIQQAIMKILE